MLFPPFQFFLLFSGFPYGNHKIDFEIYEFVSVFKICSFVPFLLDSTHKWYMIFVFVWLTSLSTITSQAIHVAANGIISLFFYGWHSTVYVLCLLYPFLCWWTFRLLPYIGYFKQWCNEHWYSCIFLNYGFLQIDTQVWDCWIPL